ncbi:Caspase domain-containing protein [Pseudosulfitobacter pseudonitzschiae]|uniref:Peptidase C14 caspase domain-containing protein n=2 Tax=Pseudosulfitobacter pseudonitzschiae TaxID=1402135 RepID=A0A073IXJ6_9RHOB|nr:hypothetical protein SUH3_07465 [Pseudosulfitobacter pseudonitzschiae]QKS11645.1 caspase family protein [Pseudosulfitobacter pseudonitzschiae]SHG22096.1 Caspase domain-containing protein [Pseudosulfitobacter pseudonitzschiae]
MMTRLIPLLLALWPLGTLAETRAVLVGVGDYLYLDADLQGPVNDVGLMADTLMRRGVAAGAITVLSDDAARVPEGAMRGLPDRAAILDALGGAIAASGPGDTVVFYFSGHGAQAPDLNGDEGGGMDEIFLPRDTRGWNGGIGAVENAILDDEFGTFTEQAAARGVQLVAILDACHSGTGFRAGPEADARARYITPAQLGLPDDLAGDAVGQGQAPAGDYVFLYAAQSDQRAFEYPVGDARLWHGDFTRALTSVMQEVPDITYTALVQAAAARMRTAGGQAAQTPDVEGPLAGAPVIGGDAPGLLRMQVDGQTLRAGLLAGVTKGSIVALYAGQLDDTPAGQAEVTQVRATEADLRYIEPFPTEKVTYAQITDRALDTSIALNFSAEARAHLAYGFDELAARVDIPLDAATPSHRVVWDGAQFALIGPDGVLDAGGDGSSIRLGAGDADALARRIGLAVGRLRLEKALAQMGQGAVKTGFALGPTGPTVGFTLTTGRMRGGTCATPDGTPQPVTGQATAHSCDVLGLRYDNTTGGMQDVTVLYINADNSITTLWPTRNLSNRIEPGGSRQMDFALVADAVLHEQVIVVSVPADPGSMRTTLAFLGGGGLPAGSMGAVAEYMASVTDPAQSRGFSLKPKGADLSVHRLDLTLTPFQTGD